MQKKSVGEARFGNGALRTRRWYWSALIRKPRLTGDTELLCIVLCWKIVEWVPLQFTRPQSEMATVEEVVEMMKSLQGQHHAMNQEISRLTAENQQFRQAGSPGLAEIATTVGQAVQTAISNANPRPNETIQFGRHQRPRQTPIVQGRLCEIHRVAQEDHVVSDCCVWLRLPGSD